MSLSPYFRTTLPLNIGFHHWASQLRQDLPEITFPISTSFKDWQGWAAQVVVSNYLTSCPIPTHHAFPGENGWRRWGAYFINSVSLPNQLNNK